MTVNTVLAQGVQAMAAQSLGDLLQAANLGTLTFAQARAEAIRSASARRAIALYPAGAGRDEMVQIGTWYNAMATAINAGLAAQGQAGQLPLLDGSAWSDSQTPDDRLAAAIGRGVLQNFGALVADLGCAAGGRRRAHDRLSRRAVPGARAPVGDPRGRRRPGRDGGGHGEPAVQRHRLRIRAPALRPERADRHARLPRHAAPAGHRRLPTLAQRVKAWFSDAVEQAAAAAAGGFLNELRSAVDWAARGVGIVLTRLVAFVFTAAVKALIELDLFVLVLAMPFWLLHATEEAFYGVLRSLVSLSVVVPAYQFIMLFVDALMGLALKYVIFGPLASGSGAVQAAGGAATMIVTALAALGGGGEIIALATFCYLVAYLFLAVYVACKTPRLVGLFLKGAGVAGAFLATFATGLIAGASSALATAAVAGGGGMAGGLLGLGGAPAAGGPAPYRPSLSPIPAAGALRRRPARPVPAWGASPPRRPRPRRRRPAGKPRPPREGSHRRPGAPERGWARRCASACAASSTRSRRTRRRTGSGPRCRPGSITASSGRRRRKPATRRRPAELRRRAGAILTEIFTIGSHRKSA